MSTNGYILVEKSLNLSGAIDLVGAKNAVLPIMAALILAKGKSVLTSVPDSSDVYEMIKLLESLGATVEFDPVAKKIVVNSEYIDKPEVAHEVMDKMRASILVMGPLLARFKKTRVALPGGCLIGARPIDLHLKSFEALDVKITNDDKYFYANHESKKNNHRIVLEYPSVGATENLLMFASMKQGITEIVNAALEPEVLDLIEKKKKMGAKIEFDTPATIRIIGVDRLRSVEHEIVPDRLEAGTLLLAAAITGGKIDLPDAIPVHMELFLEKLKQMGHDIEVGYNAGRGVRLVATKNPVAVNIKTYPFPGFPTDLQAPMMAALCLSNGDSKVEETVFENRLMHVKELEKMGAQIRVENSSAIVSGVDALYGSKVISSDIRAAAALVLAGLVAEGQTEIFGIQHWRRAYDHLEDKLKKMGANIKIIDK